MTAPVYKITPCSHDLHRWQDEQRRADYNSPETILQNFRDALERIDRAGLRDDAAEIYSEWFWK